MNFEKYADFVIHFPLLFIQNKDHYISGGKYIFKDFMKGKIQEIGNRLPTKTDLTTHLSTIFTENRVKKYICLLYTSPSPRDMRRSRMPSSA